MVNMGSESYYHVVLMSVENMQEPVCVCLVPEDLEVSVVVVAEVDMSLCYEVLVWIVV